MLLYSLPLYPPVFVSPSLSPQSLQLLLGYCVHGLNFTPCWQNQTRSISNLHYPSPIFRLYTISYEVTKFFIEYELSIILHTSYHEVLLFILGQIPFFNCPFPHTCPVTWYNRYWMPEGHLWSVKILPISGMMMTTLFNLSVNSLWPLKSISWSMGR